MRRTYKAQENPTPEQIKEYVENVLEIEGIDGKTEWIPLPEEDAYEEEGDFDGEYGPNLYLALRFYLNESGEVEHDVYEDTVDYSDYWSGISSPDEGVVFLADIPVEPGQEVTIDEILDSMFSQGYDMPYAE